MQQQVLGRWFSFWPTVYQYPDIQRRRIQWNDWPTLFKDVAEYCRAYKECRQCLSRQGSNTPLVPLPVMGGAVSAYCLPQLATNSMQLCRPLSSEIQRVSQIAHELNSSSPLMQKLLHSSPFSKSHVSVNTGESVYISICLSSMIVHGKLVWLK